MRYLAIFVVDGTSDFYAENFLRLQDVRLSITSSAHLFLPLNKHYFESDN
jgi:hypothetical protein